MCVPNRPELGLVRFVWKINILSWFVLPEFCYITLTLKDPFILLSESETFLCFFAFPRFEWNLSVIEKVFLVV